MNVLCPLLNMPGPKCYCVGMNSFKISLACHYCGGNFTDCPHYTNFEVGGKQESSTPLFPLVDKGGAFRWD